MDRDEALARVERAPVGHMATVRPEGTPHVVPFVYASVTNADGRTTLYWMVDDKPKRSNRLKRIENLLANQAVEVVVDGYDDDWGNLWWVRLQGNGRVVASADEGERALRRLASKYHQYLSAEPAGDVIAIDVETVVWWSATDPPV